MRKLLLLAALAACVDTTDPTIPEPCTNGAYDPGTCERCTWGDLDNPLGRCLEPGEDFDLDDVLAADDNCPWSWNQPQFDQDGDGIGSACDISVGTKCEGIYVLQGTGGEIRIDMSACAFVETIEEGVQYQCAQVRNGVFLYQTPNDPRFIDTQFELGVWKVDQYCARFEDAHGPVFERQDCVFGQPRTVECGPCDGPNAEFYGCPGF